MITTTSVVSMTTQKIKADLHRAKVSDRQLELVLTLLRRTHGHWRIQLTILVFEDFCEDKFAMHKALIFTIMKVIILKNI